MTIELWYLFLSSVLLAVLWIPHIIGQVASVGLLTATDYRELRVQSQFPAWVRRANRAHINLVEQYGAFAGLIVVAHLSGVSTAVTAFAAATFFWARVAHAVVFVAGFGFLMIRTVIFTIAWLAVMLIAWEILINAPAA